MVFFNQQGTGKGSIMGKKRYKYNYENATEKRESQRLHGRIDIPHDDPANHPEHLRQHEHLQILQNEELNGKPDNVKQMITDDLKETKLADTIEMLEKSVAEHGRTLDLSELKERVKSMSRDRYNKAMGITINEEK